MTEAKQTDTRTLSQKLTRGLRITLWVVAALLMLASVVYQRLTGPTHPRRESFTLGGSHFPCKLVRSQDTTQEAAVVVPDPGGDTVGTLYWRRYKAGEQYTAAPMPPENGKLIGRLPIQPPAGKLEYYVELMAPEGTARIPAGSDTVVLRYKGPVPAWALLPHIVLMFFAVLIGMRAGLSALFAPSEMRRWSCYTLGLITVGGLVFGPIVQKYAFGAYWTGFPLGYDLTDNKTLLMWLAWFVALLLLVVWKKKSEFTNRLLILAACVVMVWVYLIPHSLRGSELDYSRLDSGSDPRSAVVTGD